VTKREKRLRKLRQNPKQITFDEIKQVLEDYGFIHVRTSGSHHTFIANLEGRDWRITIPFHRPIKPPYIRAALRMIDEILQIQGYEEQENIDEQD
jgi:predicted RNA binding protein YcfA (HicA-like mRNA interferase family)